MTPASYWKQVREAEAKATPGPWGVDRDGDEGFALYDSDGEYILSDRDDYNDENNAEFCALSRTALPLALTRIEELEAALTPLAAIADAFDVKRGTGAYRDDDMVQGWHVTGLGGELVERGLTVGMLRAARVALGKP